MSSIIIFEIMTKHQNQFNENLTNAHFTKVLVVHQNIRTIFDNKTKWSTDDTIQMTFLIHKIAERNLSIKFSIQKIKKKQLCKPKPYFFQNLKTI